MGDIVGAGLVAHVPTIVLPEDARKELNEGREISLVPGLERLRREVFDVLRPDTVIVFDTHWFTTVEFVVASHDRRQGYFTSEELPRGMSAVPYDFPGDPQLAKAIAAEADAVDQCWVTAVDDPYLPIHYATVNLLGFLQGDERWVSMSVCQTGEPVDFLAAGACIGRAVEKLDRRVVLLASGAMSHTFWSLRELRKHEASDPVHLFTEAAAGADRRILDAWAGGDHASVIDGMPDYAAYKPEGRFGHYLMMVAAIGGRDCHAPGRPFSDYENSIGTAQIHVWFDRPESGWTA
ncbi:MAG: DODA-type extradiol aromatic ring-opening family dioxygenase [Acidimicrobiales bacterium]